VLVIYVPVLQTAFHTVALSLDDWLIATGVASTLLVGMEIAKLALRARRQAAAASVAHAESRPSAHRA
jgi:hypothetical protein